MKTPIFQLLKLSVVIAAAVSDEIHSSYEGVHEDSCEAVMQNTGSNAEKDFVS